MKESTRRGFEKICSALGMPAGLFCGAHIELHGSREAVIDGRCAVMQYTSQFIKINTGDGIVLINGARLCIDRMCADGITVSGCIKSVEFE